VQYDYATDHGSSVRLSIALVNCIETPKRFMAFFPCSNPCVAIFLHQISRGNSDSHFHIGCKVWMVYKKFAICFLPMCGYVLETSQETDT